MKLVMIVVHQYHTEEFYGASVPNIVGEVFDLSNPVSRNLKFRRELKSGENIMEFPTMNMMGDIYQWTLRQDEILSSSRDYELTIDINSVTAKYDELICIPNTIKTLIGEFCNPVIASGYIIFDISQAEE